MNIANSFIEEQIQKRMVLDNPWWESGKVDDDFTQFPRRAYLDDFYELVTDLSVKRAVILMGPRRVGKTVMIYHSIDRLISSGIDPKKIIYISVDTPIYNNISLEDFFLLARKALKNEESYEGYYVFFDEIQYLKNWEVHLKSMVDTFRSSRFVASGSAAAALKMKSIESGAGRFSDFLLPPLTFYEYIQFKKLDSLVVKSNNGISPYDTINIDALNRHFVEYINFGGYPEVVFSEAIRRNPGQYIKNDIIDKVLLRDLPSLYGISDIQELNKLFVHIAFRSGNEFSYESLSTEAGIKKETIKRYLEYLEAAFLIKVVNRIDQNAKRMQRVTSFKIYLTNPSLRCALFTPINEDDEFMGSMVETAVFSQWIQGGKTDFFYANWAKGRSKGEVDIVWVDMATQKAISLAEIKWTDRFAENPTELKSLYSFLSLNPSVKKIFVTSKTRFGTYDIPEGKIMFIPVAIYSYWISNFLYHSKRMQSEQKNYM
ncbi:ATP-binding protein [Phocaeicola plebeius]|jgi:predicted AAA+ superfamily ATPase|uniref:ATP-binding protein n=1 Tax=Phocaeicola plebeius TaxID=310297 RepID=UPI00307AD1E6